MNTERRLKWDNIKAILIFFVVFGHIAYCTNSYSYFGSRMQLWIYAFHMPAFFLVSGHLSKRAINNNRWDKAFSYLLLYFLLKVLYFFADIYINHSKEASISFFYEDDIPWFALSLFWSYAITIMIKRIAPAYVFTWAIFSAVIIGYSEVQSFLVIQRTVTFFPFFYCGYFFDEKAVAVSRTTAAKIISVLILVISLAIVLLLDNSVIKKGMLLFRGRFPYYSIDASDYLCGWTWRLGAMAIAFMFIGAIFILIPDKKIGLSNVGKHTLSIYALHQIILNKLYTIQAFNHWLLSGHVFINSIMLSLIIVYVIGWFNGPDKMLRKAIAIPKR